MHGRPNTGIWHTSGIGLQSAMLKTAREGDELAREAHRLSALGQSVSDVAQAVFETGGLSPTAAAQRRRTSYVWLSPRQFARRFGVGMSAVYGAVERGEVPAIRVGRHIRIPPDSVVSILLHVTADRSDNE
jgi:excisionase family DNA binding protein